jgi:predicted DNA-binding protein with PD1-like motif
MITNYALRLRPGDKLKESITAFVKEKHIKAGWINTCVGSMTSTNIRFANVSIGTMKTGFFEILSLNGTVSENGLHLHIMVSDEKGNVRGGHLLENNIIFTTAEIIITEDQSLIFTREKDNETGWLELKIVKK